MPFYRDAVGRAGVGVDAIRSADDVRRLPFTMKDDLRQSYPLGLLAVPRAELARVHGSSGTTGKPTFVAYTRADLDTWSGLVARFLVAGGLRPEHLVHVAFGYGLFTGGFGLHYGIERVGAAVVPAAGGNTPRQVMLIRDLGAEVLVCTPSYALHIAEVARAEGLPAGRAAAPARPLRRRALDRGDARRRSSASSASAPSTTTGSPRWSARASSGECPYRTGMHVQEDHFLVECVDPDTLAHVPDGEVGELVFTTLTKQAMPVLRYRTRDLAALDRSPCPCGRTGVRMSRVVGRSDDMLIIRGVNVFPSQIEEALLRVEGTAPHYLIEISRPGSLDEAVVKVEMRPADFRDEMRQLQELHDRIDREIHAVTGVRMTRGARRAEHARALRREGAARARPPADAGAPETRAEPLALA